MKSKIGIVLLIGITPTALFGQRTRAPAPEACQDEAAMLGEATKTVTDLVEAVKKESLQDFQKAYHQKSCLSKLTFCVSAVSGLVSCLEKAAEDTLATKQQVADYKAKRERYSKLQDRITQDRNALKATEVAKEAKVLIEKLDLTH